MTDYLRIPVDGDKLSVRVVTLLPEVKQVHWHRENERWSIRECIGAGCKSCGSQDETERRRLTRYLWEFSTTEGVRQHPCPRVFHDLIEGYRYRMGNGLFLVTDFLLWRERLGNPIVQYRMEPA